MKKNKIIMLIIMSIILLCFVYNSIFYSYGKFELLKANYLSDTFISNATLMSTGDLILLGTNCQDPNIYIYDYKERRRRLGGRHKVNLCDPQAISLKNGNILIAGGDTCKTSNLSENNLYQYGEIFNPKTGEVNLTGKNLFPNRHFSMTELSDGKILITGGTETPNKAQIYDVYKNQFYQTGDLNEGRYKHSSILLKNGNVLIVGGTANNAEMFNYKTGKFTILCEFKTVATEKSAQTILLNNNIVFIVAYENNPLVQIFKPIETLALYAPNTTKIKEIYIDTKINNSERTISALNNGEILFTGGLNKAEIFNPKNSKLILVNSKMKAPRWRHKTVTLNNGNVLIFGGWNDKGYNNVEQAELFIPAK